MHLTSSLMPVRKRGRPKNSEKALQRDANIDILAFRPGDWRKCPIRHPQYKTGIVRDFRVKPDKAKTVVWNVIYPDAPGGIQDYEVEEQELKAALDLYRRWMRDTTSLTNVEL